MSRQRERGPVRDLRVPRPENDALEPSIGGVPTAAGEAPASNSSLATGCQAMGGSGAVEVAHVRRLNAGADDARRRNGSLES